MSKREEKLNEGEGAWLLLIDLEKTFIHNK